MGRTIFNGNKIQEFQVELIGVLKNVLAPKQDAILARLSGPTIQKTGVVAGMSGSPVYIDGKLLGAVSRAFPFAKEPYTLITPIQDMLQVVPERSSIRTRSQVAATLPWYSARAPSLGGTIDRWIPVAESGPKLWTALLDRWTQTESAGRFRLPMNFSGFDSRVISEYQPVLQAMGFQPQGAALLSSGSASESSMSSAATGEVAPGSMISMVLLYGDLNLNADCTVTYRQGNNVYACGHPILLMGPLQVPLAQAHVLATVPFLSESQKIDALGPIIGSIRQDRFGAIYGVLGEKSPVIPVHLHLDSSLHRATDYDINVAEQPLLSPILVNMAVVSALEASERMEGPSTLDLNGSIQLSDGEAIRLGDVISSNLSAAGEVGAAVATPLSYLLNGQFPKLEVRSIDLNVVSQDESRLATLEQVWSTQSEVRPGDHIVVTVVERTPSGEQLTQTIPVEIPENVNDKVLSLVVGSGPSINALQMQFVRPGNPPSALHQLVRELNRARRNDRVYALLMAPQRSFVMEGTDYPSPPPSLLQTFLADPAISSKISYQAGSVVGDFNTSALPYTIEGSETLYLKVLDAAK
ncbi:MAG TPA: SpoIVB peptidase S55 domain-containing protein [Terriglobia bacterium]|nr:SpoIVB peptidase S55 domain-containing protein [Terriglobia bacterium]